MAYHHYNSYRATLEPCYNTWKRSQGLYVAFTELCAGYYNQIYITQSY